MRPTAINTGKRKLQRRSVVIWASILDDRIVGPVKVLLDVEVTSASHFNILKYTLAPWLDDLPLSLRQNLIFTHDDAPFY